MKEKLVNIFRSKLFIYTVLALPGLYTLYPILSQNPTFLADPAKYLLEYVGKTATLLFIFVLSLSPMRALIPNFQIIASINRHRRVFGVSAFVYVVFHLSFYLIYEGILSQIVENFQKPFILSGAFAFFILFILTSTSTDWAVRKFGYTRWKRIHRMAYLAALLIFYHQAVQEKTGAVQTVYFFAPLAVLEFARVSKYILKKKTLKNVSSKSHAAADRR